ncbi:alcohol dehydrogenase catalytic domain-containing protein [Streptomyces mirabilis]|uniref:alcohol dehydrogenase catalytic domain-containing protein n=1 Tax=Streptomyces mirabilis TaxID=68239 RepID=UPI003D9DEA43
MNRRVVHTRGGPPAGVLTVIEEPEPTPGPGQVLIRITAFPVHPGDLQAVEAYPEEAAKPVPAGVEATGVLEAIGPGTHVAPGVTVGGRVTVFPQPGAWSQWIVADAGAVVAVPDELSDEVAAQMLVNPLTTVMLRREAQEHPAFGYDGLLVQTAAGSSVGRLLTGVSLMHNLALVDIVRSDRGAAELRKRFPGVPVVATEHPGWEDEIRRASRRPPGQCGPGPDRRKADGEPSGPVGSGREAGQLRADRRGADLGTRVDAAAQVADATGQEHRPVAVRGLRRETGIRCRHREGDRARAQGPVRRGGNVRP